LFQMSLQEYIYIYMHKRTETAVGGIISPSFLDRLNDDEGA
jgi:hypothetical protein